MTAKSDIRPGAWDRARPARKGVESCKPTQNRRGA
jgi:hypothetical protein